MGELGTRENLLTNKLSFARRHFEVLKDPTAVLLRWVNKIFKPGYLGRKFL